MLNQTQSLKQFSVFDMKNSKENLLSLLPSELLKELNRFYLSALLDDLSEKAKNNIVNLYNELQQKSDKETVANDDKKSHSVKPATFVEIKWKMVSSAHTPVSNTVIWITDMNNHANETQSWEKAYNNIPAIDEVKNPDNASCCKVGGCLTMTLLVAAAIAWTQQANNKFPRGLGLAALAIFSLTALCFFISWLRSRAADKFHENSNQLSEDAKEGLLRFGITHSDRLTSDDIEKGMTPEKQEHLPLLTPVRSLTLNF